MAKAPATKPVLPFIDVNAGKWYTEADFKSAIRSGELTASDMVYFRASSVGKLMGKPEKNEIPSGAITEMERSAGRIIYGTKPQLNMLAIQKGLECEDLGIDLYNEINGTWLEKNKTRMYYWHPIAGVILTGEWDLKNEKLSKTIDIKLAYSTESMPVFLGFGSYSNYEWQLDSYTILDKTMRSELAYCMVSTPEHLIKKGDPESWHIVDHIDENFRLSSISKERDSMRINQLLNRLVICKQEMLKMLQWRGFDINNLSVEYAEIPEEE